MKQRTRVSALPLALLAAGSMACAAAPQAVHVERAYEELSQNDPDLAAAHAHLREALAIDPEDPYALLDLGVVYHHAGRYVEAAGYYERVIALGDREEPLRTSRDWAEDLDLVEIARHNLAQLAAALPPEGQPQP